MSTPVQSAPSLQQVLHVLSFGLSIALTVPVPITLTVLVPITLTVLVRIKLTVHVTITVQDTKSNKEYVRVILFL
jgi:hypothetical protein